MPSWIFFEESETPSFQNSGHIPVITKCPERIISPVVPRPSALDIQPQIPSQFLSPLLPSYDPGLEILGLQSLGIIFPLRKWMVPNTGFCLVWFLPNCTYYFQHLLYWPCLENMSQAVLPIRY